MKRAILVLAILALASIGAQANPFHVQTGVIDESIGTNVALAAAVVPAGPTCTVGATGHCVGLSWTASTTTGVGYNIFRGTSAGGEGTTPINATPLAAATTSYTDATVTGNTTYWYVAQSTCTGVSTCPAGFSGSSANSNEISVVVPASVPLPPANLTGVAQ